MASYKETVEQYIEQIHTDHNNLYRIEERLRDDLTDSEIETLQSARSNLWDWSQWRSIELKRHKYD